MLIKANDVIGAKIYTVDTGKEVEDVDDVIYSPEENKVVALLAKSKGIFSDAKVIFLTDAKGVGKDAVLIESESMMKNSSDIPQKISHIAEEDTYLTKTKVITEDGKDLGEVSDILFDTLTGQVKEFEVSQGLRNLASGKKKVNIQDIVTVGKDATIVKGYTEEKFEEQAEERGIKGRIMQTAERVREEVPKAYEKTLEKTEELAGKTREKAQEAIQRTREKGEEAKYQAQKGMSTVKRKGKKIKRKAEKELEESKGGEY